MRIWKDRYRSRFHFQCFRLLDSGWWSFYILRLLSCCCCCDTSRKTEHTVYLRGQVWWTFHFTSFNYKKKSTYFTNKNLWKTKMLLFSHRLKSLNLLYAYRTTTYYSKWLMHTSYTHTWKTVIHQIRLNSVN